MDLLWSEEEGSKELNYSSVRCTDDDIDGFLDKNGLETIITTKDNIPNGFEDDRMLSICSIPSSSSPSSKGCILKITKELDIAPCIVATNNAKKTPWVNELNTKVNLSMTESEVSLRKNMFEVC